MAIQTFKALFVECFPEAKTFKTSNQYIYKSYIFSQLKEMYPENELNSITNLIHNLPNLRHCNIDKYLESVFFTYENISELEIVNEIMKDLQQEKANIVNYEEKEKKYDFLYSPKTTFDKDQVIHKPSNTFVNRGYAQIVEQNDVILKVPKHIKSSNKINYEQSRMNSIVKKMNHTKINPKINIDINKDKDEMEEVLMKLEKLSISKLKEMCKEYNIPLQKNNNKLLGSMFNDKDTLVSKLITKFNDISICEKELFGSDDEDE